MIFTITDNVHLQRVFLVTVVQRNWQQDEEKQNKNTTQYVLDAIIRKQIV
jgi:hypothetical protein